MFLSFVSLFYNCRLLLLFVSLNILFITLNIDFLREYFLLIVWSILVNVVVWLFLRTLGGFIIGILKNFKCFHITSDFKKQVYLLNLTVNVNVESLYCIWNTNCWFYWWCLCVNIDCFTIGYNIFFIIDDWIKIRFTNIFEASQIIWN